MIIAALCAVLFAASVTADDCTSFSTNGSTASYFKYYRFYDFRNVNAKRFLTRSSNATVFPISETIDDALWEDDWELTEQSRPALGIAIPMQYTPSNIYIEDSSDSSTDYTTYLALLTNRLEDSQNAAQMIYAPANLTSASLRVLARLTGAPGGVAAIFTYLNDTTESDIEILTGDPTDYLHFSNQPTNTNTGAMVPGSTWNVSMAASANGWEDWNVYRLDWVPGQSAWYVNGVLTANTTINVPRVESAFYMSMWGDGDYWCGNMTIGASAVLQVQWVEMVFNSSVENAVTPGSDEIAIICSIDELEWSPLPTVVAPLVTGIPSPLGAAPSQSKGAVTILPTGQPLAWLQMLLTMFTMFICLVYI